MSTPSLVLADDLLDGAKAIAAYTGFDERRVFYMAASGAIPTFKVGPRKICAFKSAIRAHFEALQKGASK